MPLVKAGRIVDDRFVRVLDDAPVPEGVPVILPAARLPRRCARPRAPPGPDRRDLAERSQARRARALSRLDRADRAGVSELSATAAPTARRGCCASAIGFRGELRATGQVLRDQLLFLQRAGFDAFEVTKDADAAAFAEAVQRYSVFYQPTGDGRVSALETRFGRATPATIRGAREFVP